MFFFSNPKIVKEKRKNDQKWVVVFLSLCVFIICCIVKNKMNKRKKGNVTRMTVNRQRERDRTRDR